jgi:hypothetical protein
LRFAGALATIVGRECLRVLEAPNVEGRERGRDEACCADARECANESQRMESRRGKFRRATFRRRWVFSRGRV